MAADYPALLEAYSRTIHVGMQLSIERNMKTGRIGQAQYNCLRSIGQDRLRSVVSDILAFSLNESELQEAESFLSSPSGRLYAKQGVLEVYARVGAPAPEPFPELSSADRTAIAAFSATSAGRKLIDEAVLESPIQTRAIGAEIRMLIEPCRTAH